MRTMSRSRYEAGRARTSHLCGLLKKLWGSAMRVYRTFSREQVIQLQRALQRWENDGGAVPSDTRSINIGMGRRKDANSNEAARQVGLHHSLHVRYGRINDSESERRSSVEHLYPQGAADRTPAELAGLATQLNNCNDSRGRFFGIRSAVDAANGLARARFVTAVVLVPWPSGSPRFFSRKLKPYTVIASSVFIIGCQSANCSRSS